MKKKGLIISTVVMVVVLIAALTTGTFAWFSMTSTTKVEDINVSVAAGANLRLGVTNSNTIDTSASITSFRSGTVTWGATQKNWNNTGDEGLGYSLDTSMKDLKFNQAVYTWNGTTMDGSSTSDKKISDANLKHALATGTADGVTSVKIDDAKAATINGGDDGSAQVLHLVIGLAAAPGKDVYGITGKIKIDVSKNTSSTLGMNAAMYYVYQVITPDGAASAKPLFDTTTTATNESGVTQGEFFTTSHRNTENLSAADGEIEITICEQQEEEEKLEDTAIYQLDLYIFINGWDEDCITAATGTSCAIQISFEANTTAKNA